MSPKGAAALLILLGLSRFPAAELGWKALDEAAAATGAAPASRLFGGPILGRRGPEPTAIEWVDHQGGRHELPLDDAALRRIRGPWPRRHVFSTAIRRSWDLDGDEAWCRTIRYGFCSCAPVLVELGLDPKRMAAPPRFVVGAKGEVAAPCR